MEAGLEKRASTVQVRSLRRLSSAGVSKCLWTCSCCAAEWAQSCLAVGRGRACLGNAGSKTDPAALGSELPRLRERSSAPSHAVLAAAVAPVLHCFDPRLPFDDSRTIPVKDMMKRFGSQVGPRFVTCIRPWLLHDKCFCIHPYLHGHRVLRGGRV